MEELRKIAGQALTDPKQFIIEIVVSARKGPRKVLVLVDSEESIGIDDCAAISRRLSAQLEANPLWEDNYILEVSTPGVDHPLTDRRQFKKHIGRSLKVKLLSGEVHEGKLLGIEGDMISLQKETGSGKQKKLSQLDIAYTDIDKAFVIVSFK